MSQEDGTSELNFKFIKLEKKNGTINPCIRCFQNDCSKRSSWNTIQCAFKLSLELNSGMKLQLCYIDLCTKSRGGKQNMPAHTKKLISAIEFSVISVIYNCFCFLFDFPHIFSYYHNLVTAQHIKSLYPP